MSGSTNVLNDSSGSHIITGSTIYDIKGEEVVGVKKFTVDNKEISIFSSNDNIKDEISQNGFLSVNTRYFYTTGSKEYTVKNKTEKFYQTEYDTSMNIKNTRFSIVNKDSISSSSELIKLKICFVDIDKQYDVSRTYVDLDYLFLGNVYYEMFDIETNEILIKNQNEFTQLRYDGKFYYINLFMSNEFKNKRVSFRFYYKDFSLNQDVVLEDRKNYIRF